MIEVTRSPWEDTEGTWTAHEVRVRDKWWIVAVGLAGVVGFLTALVLL